MEFVKAKIDKKKTGDKIKELIKSSGITYEKLAILLDLASPRVLFEWSRGNKLPSIENLINLALILDVEIKEIIKLKG